MSYEDANALLAASGAPAAKFPTIGTVVKGTVVDAKVTQQTDIKMKPKFYDDGNPMKQLVVTLATDERDPKISGDDGNRRVFIKGQMLAALKAALAAVGAKGIDAGALLAVKFDSEVPPETPGFSPAKQFVVQYKAPVATGVSADDLL